MSAFALALTPGEPAGIGPDITVQFAQAAQPFPCIAYADPLVLQARAALLGLPLQLHLLDDSPVAAGLLSLSPLPATGLYVRAVSCPHPVVPGTLAVANARYVMAALSAAARDCLAVPDQLALVTGPVQKSVINEAGIPFTGHTEFLQELASVDKVVMMLATSRLRVALVTTHLPLHAVPAAITTQEVHQTLHILHHDLQRYFTGRDPVMLVCGLNPHAGEGGHLGTEDRDIIVPVLQALRMQGLRVEGPVPADTAFIPERLHGVDVVVAMYHDQGLPVLKAQGFGEAINITLGLPFVRTSVDHGTALPLAGTGKADAGSLFCAAGTAARMLAQATSLS